MRDRHPLGSFEFRRSLLHVKPVNLHISTPSGLNWYVGDCLKSGNLSKTTRCVQQHDVNRVLNNSLASNRSLIQTSQECIENLTPKEIETIADKGLDLPNLDLPWPTSLLTTPTNRLGHFGPSSGGIDTDHSGLS